MNQEEKELLNKLLDPENRARRKAEREKMRAEIEKMKAELEKDIKENPEDYSNALTGNDIIKLLINEKNGDQEAQKTLNEIRSNDIGQEIIKSFEEEIEFQKTLPDILKAPWYKELLNTNVEFSQELFNFADYEKLTPKNAYISNSKVANELINISTNSLKGSVTRVNIAPEKKEAVKIITYFEDNDKITIKGDPLTPFDLVVHRAICDLWEAGKQENKKDICFNLQQVYRAMNGTNDSNINDEVLEKIKRSIGSGIVKRIVIDCTEQIEKWKKGKKPKKAEYESYLLPLDRIKLVMQNGEQVEGYKFIKCPPVYAYSKDIGQIINIPKNLLETNHQGKKYRLSNTTENIIIRELLIKQIAIYKNQKNKIKNNLINYENLFKKAGIKTDKLDKVQAKRKRENVKKILDHFIAEKYIKSYKEYKEGKTIKGNEIFF